MRKQEFHSYFALFAALGLSSYQLLLCFLNTHGVAVNNNIVAATEGFILLAVTISVIRHKNITELALPAFISAYFIVMFAIRGEIDLQGMRNLFIIYIMFQLGMQLSDRTELNRIIWMISFVAAVFCIFEYFFIDLYLANFDILHYYTARGLVTEEQLGYLNTNLWISGMRPNGRTLLPFLGDQRVSSIFLEPVSMGNYATIVCMWALSFDLNEWRKAILHFAAGAFFIIASDSRFASLIVVMLCAIRFVPLLQKRGVLYLLPVLCLVGHAYFTTLQIADPRMDDLPGRLAKSGFMMLDLRLMQIFGVGSVDELYDMGIPYSLVVFGVLLCALLWIKLVFLNFATDQGTRFRAMLTVYCMGLLFISGTSFYASKTAGLLWLIMGVLYTQKPPEEIVTSVSVPADQTATNLLYAAGPEATT